MKMLQTTLFSLLMGTAIAAYALSSADKRLVEKCDQVRSDWTEAQNATEENALEPRNDSNREELKREYETLKKKETHLQNKYQDLDCRDVYGRRNKEEKGLSQ